MTSTTVRKEKDVEEFFNISGAAMNHSRSSTMTPKKTSPDKTAELHIDLFNFDDPQFEDSKYVLTSPRSLEACSRLGSKPVEILYKPLIDFQEELLPQGFSLRTIYEIYDQQEHERQNKLQLCHEERERVIIEDTKLGITGTGGPTITKSASRPVRQPTLTRKSTVREVLHSSDGYESDVSGTGGDDLIEEPSDCDRGSLQRQRTAWTTGIGHERVSKEELNQRAADIHNKGKALQEQTQKTGTKKRPKSSPAKRTTVVPASKRTQSARALATTKNRKKQARLRKAEGGHHDSQESITDVSSITSSRASRPWIRDPLADAKPITDPVLRQKLGASATSARLSARKSAADGSTKRHSAPVMRGSDQKILQLMIAKREAEKKENEQRQSVRTQWEEERKQAAAAKNAANNQRRRSAVDKKRFGSTSSVDSSPVHHPHQYHSQNGLDAKCGCGRNHDRMASCESLGRRTPTGGRYSQSVEDMTESCRRNWVMASQKRLELQKQQMQEKKMREMERKKSVEKRLEEQRREAEEYQNKVKEKQQRAFERAESVRISKEQQRQLRIRLKNFQEKQRHEEKTEQLKRQSTEDLAAMRASVDLKNHLIDAKKKDMHHRKVHDSKRRSLDLDQKLKQYRDNKTKQDEQLQQWHTDLLTYRQQQLNLAEKRAQDAVLEKKRKAEEDRRHKEQLQKDNMEKLLSAEEEWRTEVEAAIALKDTRSKMMQREKEEIIEESRALARASQQLREEFKQHYSLNDLDKLNQRAQIEAKLEAPPLASVAGNMAKLHI